jgi:hypothetical protein
LLQCECGSLNISEIARAKENYWKRFRGKEEENMEEEERKVWNIIKEAMSTLKEDGNWIREEMRIEKRKEEREEALLTNDMMFEARGGDLPEAELRSEGSPPVT